MNEEKSEQKSAFELLHPPIQEVIRSVGFSTPTEIQQRLIPAALRGRNVTGIAKTGQGKTVAYVLPVLQKLLESGGSFSALVLTPTRELCLQVAEEFRRFGGPMGVRVAVLVGGVDPGVQQLSLAREPHVVVGTPACVQFHVERSKGFRLSGVQIAVLDEADKLLDLQFEQQTTQVLREAAPRTRQTLFLTATMNRELRRLQEETTGGVVIDLLRREQDAAGGAVNKELLQEKVVIRGPERLEALLGALSKAPGPAVVFCSAREEVRRVQLVVEQFSGAETFALYGEMPQEDRLRCAEGFRRACASGGETV